MKLFIGLLLLSFIAGVVLRRRRPAWSVVGMAVVCVLVSIGYYFFNQI